MEYVLIIVALPLMLEIAALPLVDSSKIAWSYSV